MGVLSLALAAIFGLTLSPDANGRSIERQSAIREASQRFGIPMGWIESVIRVESGDQAERFVQPIRSARGAMGVMQIMPKTWRALRGR